MKSVYLLALLSDKAKKWSEKHLNYESWQLVGGLGISIDWRYIESIREAMLKDGLKNGKDFKVL